MLNKSLKMTRKGYIQKKHRLPIFVFESDSRIGILCLKKKKRKPTFTDFFFSFLKTVMKKVGKKKKSIHSNPETNRKKTHVNNSTGCGVGVGVREQK